MKNYLVVLACILYTVVSPAQWRSQIDSLKADYFLEDSDTSQVNLAIKIAKRYLDKNNDSALFYHNLALNKAVTAGSNNLKARALNALSLFYFDTHQYKQAITNFKETEALQQLLGNIDELGYVQNYIGFCYTSLYAEDKAIEYFLRSIKSFKSVGNRDGVGMNQIDIGNLYYGQENYEFAKKYFNDALEIYVDLNDKLGIESCYINLGNATADSGDCKGGLDFYQEALNIALEFEDTNGVAVSFNNIGDCYITLKEFEKAENYFLKAKELAKTLNDHELDAILLLNLADVKNKTNNHTKAIALANQSVQISQKYGFVDFEIDNLDIITQSYEALGDEKNALKYHRIFKEKRDSLIKTDMSKKVQLFQALNDLEKSDFTIEQLSSQNAIAQLKYENEKKISFYLIIGLVLFGVMILIMIAQQTSKRKAYNLLEFKNHQINTMNDEIETQRDHLKKLNDTKDQFFSIIAHDLKNPFNSINGFTELMIENNQVYDDKKRLKFLKIIKDSTGKVTVLLDNLLIWANNQSGNIEFKPEKINIKKQVESSLSLFEAQAMNKGISMNANIETELSVKADCNMFDTVIRNLVSNALKFTDTGGTVSITASTQKQAMSVVVSDTGIGMSEADLANLFDINNKPSSVGTRNERGSGLGLILCKDFIERHGGSLRVESEIGKGTQVRFTLPV